MHYYISGREEPPISPPLWLFVNASVPLKHALLSAVIWSVWYMGFSIPSLSHIYPIIEGYAEHTERLISSLTLNPDNRRPPTARMPVKQLW